MDRKNGVTRVQTEVNTMSLFRTIEPWKRLLHLDRPAVSFLESDLSKLLMQFIEDAYVHCDFCDLVFIY